MQLGIPTEAIALTVALNVILEFAAVAVNLFCLQGKLVEASGSLAMLDPKRLRGGKQKVGCDGLWICMGNIRGVV